MMRKSSVAVYIPPFDICTRDIEALSIHREEEKCDNKDGKKVGKKKERVKKSSGGGGDSRAGCLDVI